MFKKLIMRWAGIEPASTPWQGVVLPLDYQRTDGLVRLDRFVGLFLILYLLNIYASAFWAEPGCRLHEYRFPGPPAILALVSRHYDPPIIPSGFHPEAELLRESRERAPLEALPALCQPDHLLHLLVVLQEFPYLALAGSRSLGNPLDP